MSIFSIGSRVWVTEPGALYGETGTITDTKYDQRGRLYQVVKLDFPYSDDDGFVEDQFWLPEEELALDKD